MKCSVDKYEIRSGLNNLNVFVAAFKMRVYWVREKYLQCPWRGSIKPGLHRILVGNT